MPESSQVPERSQTPDRLSCQKDALRSAIRARRRALSDEARTRASEAIAARVLALPELATTRSVLVYGASAEEADPAPIERALRGRGVQIAYPRVSGTRMLELHWVDDSDELTAGAFGLREPLSDTPVTSLAEIDTVIVPGVAFDTACNRIGYGGGFYDTLLASAPGTLLTIGIAFDEQIIASVPCEEFDRALNIVTTPTRTIRRHE